MEYVDRWLERAVPGRCPRCCDPLFLRNSLECRVCESVLLLSLLLLASDGGICVVMSRLVIRALPAITSGTIPSSSLLSRFCYVTKDFIVGITA